MDDSPITENTYDHRRRGTFYYYAANNSCAFVSDDKLVRLTCTITEYLDSIGLFDRPTIPRLAL